MAIRHVLDEPAVAAAIIGARHAHHLPDTLAALHIELTDHDRETLLGCTGGASGPRGDVYTLERTAGGRHAAIMRYNLNTA